MHCAVLDMCWSWAPAKLRDSQRIRHADWLARRAAQVPAHLNPDVVEIPNDLLAGLTHCTEVLNEARRFRWDDYATMIRL